MAHRERGYSPQLSAVGDQQINSISTNRNHQLRPPAGQPTPNVVHECAAKAGMQRPGRPDGALRRRVVPDDHELVFLREDFSTDSIKASEVVASITLRTFSEEMHSSC